MATVTSVLKALTDKGTEKTRKTYARHGMKADALIGVSMADLKAIAKTIKGQQELALELYQTGKMEAMYLAGMVANGAKMSKAELTKWADGSKYLQMISEYPVPWVTVEFPEASALAMQWIKSPKDHVASCGWCSYSGLVATKADDALDLKEIETLMGGIAKGIHAAPNRVKANMNSFVISVGTYVGPLFKQAKACATKMGTVSVDMGDTACEIRVASESIAKIEAAGHPSAKRKSIRC